MSKRAYQEMLDRMTDDAAEQLAREMAELEEARLEWLADTAAQEAYREWSDSLRRNDEQVRIFTDEIPY